MVSKSEAGGDKIIRDNGSRGSKETTNGVLETPPLEESDGEGPDIAATQLLMADQKPKVYYSDKSESSVESMMGDTPSNYNIPNGRLDKKNKAGKRAKLNYDSNLEIITEIEYPNRAPQNLGSIKHLKTTKNERQFINSVLGSEHNSYIGDKKGLYNKGNESDRGPSSDIMHVVTNPCELRRFSKSNLRNNVPGRSLEHTQDLQHRLKYNQYMISNKGSENNSIIEGIEDHKKPNFKPGTENNDSEVENAIKSSLPPIRYPKFKRKSIKKKILKIIEDKNLSTTSVNDLEAAYLSNVPSKDIKKSFYGPKVSNKLPNVNQLSEDQDE